eukprot:scaffold2856_cov424-Pavlova_lutheri.AAC.3
MGECVREGTRDFGEGSFFGRLRRHFRATSAPFSCTRASAEHCGRRGSTWTYVLGRQKSLCYFK